jgi:hypothetical protein
MASRIARHLGALALALLLAAATCGVAQGLVVHLHSRAYGELLSPRARAALAAPGSAGARGLPGAPRARVSPLTVGGPQSLLTYGNGPLMLSSTLYLIFWGAQGSFASSYTTPLVQYAKDLQTDSARGTDEFSVAELYANAANEHIGDGVTFGGESSDTTAYPPLDKSEGCTAAAEPCVTDSQIRAEVVKEIEANGWPKDPEGAPQAQYLVYTPAGVVTCDEPGSCTDTEEGYCAYHSQIKLSGGHVATYSDLPYVGECDSGQAPAGVEGNADADGTLDSEIHELAESATDPAPGSGYTDGEGYEIGDKCTYPLVSGESEIYGAPLGGSLSEHTAFDQTIGGHSYYTQQLWSNAPTKTPRPAAPGEAAGCVARIGATPVFTAPAGAQTGQSVAFDAGGSSDVAAALTGYTWNYGDGSTPVTSSSVAGHHYYTQPGTYQVSLTVSDSAGAADASTQTLPVTVGGAALAAPSASVSAPAEAQTYSVGQAVATSFSCTEAAGGPGIQSCTDSADATSPGTLDTATPGPHSYTVTALSVDGLGGTATVHYTVTSETASPTPEPGGGSTSGGGTGSSLGSGFTPGGGASPSPGARTALTRTQKLAKAIAACQKLKKRKRAACVLAAKRRYAPPRKPRKPAAGA